MATSLYLSPRMADALLWLGRYQQRLETLGKESLLQFDSVIDKNPQAGVELFRRLGVSLSYPCATEFLKQACYGQHSASLFWISAQARENAIIVRDLLSESLFGSVNGVYYALKQHQTDDNLDAYELEQLLAEIEYFWGRLSTRLMKSRAVQFILLGQALEMIDLKLRLYGEVDSLVEDAKQLNLFGSQLTDDWQTFEPLTANLEDNMKALDLVSARVISYAI
jgi:uncharacterized alpha-E superfamily protein